MTILLTRLVNKMAAAAAAAASFFLFCFTFQVDFDSRFSLLLAT